MEFRENTAMKEAIAVQKILAVAVMSLLLAGLMASEVMAGASASQTITIIVMPIDPGQTGETSLKWSTNTPDSNTKDYELISAIWAGGGGCKVRYTAEAADTAEQGTSGVIEVSYILTTANKAPLGVSTHQLMIRGGFSLDQAVTYGEVVYITITDTE